MIRLFKRKVPVILGITLGLILAVSLLLKGLIHTHFVPENKISTTETAHFFSYFMNLNKIEVQTSEGVKKEDIEIRWNGNPVYKNGNLNNKSVMKSRYNYGENEFMVQVRGQRVGRFIQVKFNNWHFHKYTFIVKKVNDKLHCDLNIIGPDDHYDIVK